MGQTEACPAFRAEQGQGATGTEGRVAAGPELGRGRINMEGKTKPWGKREGKTDPIG